MARAYALYHSNGRRVGSIVRSDHRQTIEVQNDQIVRGIYIQVLRVQRVDFDVLDCGVGGEPDPLWIADALRRERVAHVQQEQATALVKRADDGEVDLGVD